MKTIKYKELLEELASLEHEQWKHWSINISKEENISKKRIKRWKYLWQDYKYLKEDDKIKDRIWANKVINILKKYIE